MLSSFVDSNARRTAAFRPRPERRALRCAAGTEPDCRSTREQQHQPHNRNKRKSSPLLVGLDVKFGGNDRGLDWPHRYEQLRAAQQRA